MQSKLIIRLTFIGSFITWLAVMFCNAVILLSNIRDLNPGLPLWLPRALMVLYILLVFYYYKFRIERRETLDFTRILWQVFIVGLPVTIISLAVRGLLYLLGATKFSNDAFFIDIIYHINLALFLSFLIAALVSWKRLILYQRSKVLIILWYVFKSILLLFLLYDISALELYGYIEKILIGILGIVAIILSVNVKWIAYLGTKQKWLSLLFILLIFFYLYYFLSTIIDFSRKLNVRDTPFVDFITQPFGLSIFGFVILYSIFSFLVILFSLPTSSVFEQKSGEVINLKRISQSIQTEQNEESIYRILLDSTVLSTLADAAWIDVKKVAEENNLFAYKIDEVQISAIKKYLKYEDLKQHFCQDFEQNKKTLFQMKNIHINSFRSILIFPLIVKDEITGILVLLKEIRMGFNKEMIKIVSTFSNQTRISVENFRLLKEAFQHERYQEELKIAKKTHEKLLPKKLDQDKDFEMASFSKSPDEVGGDYYDTIRIGEHQVALIVADVSGKGVTAAFHMAQMKGIFRSLAGQGLAPNEFMLRANEVLVSCLERRTFISAIYFVFDTRRKNISYSRAGHCPILYYQAKSDTSQFLKDRGTALGILQNTQYIPLIESKEISYASGDIMLLYTDGVTEAKNKDGEEYGYNRLQTTFMELKDGSAADIQAKLISRLYIYSGMNSVKDDYTTIIIRFK